MIHFSDELGILLENTRLARYAGQLIAYSKQTLSTTRHGDWTKWNRILNRLPQLPNVNAECSGAVITIGKRELITQEQYDQIGENLMLLHPWRKGPFDLYGVQIDAEWRSNMKWDRLSASITPLRNRFVLDVGCGNGYYLWRMLGAGAKLAIGIDPGQLFLAQFRSVKHFSCDAKICMLPLKLEDLPDMNGQGFDTVFSMGVLYHRRSAMDHLRELRRVLANNGQLVLETLIVNDDELNNCEPYVLELEDRYARMRNVWCIPSLHQLIIWCSEAGFINCRIVDVNITTSQEQRSTAWMRFESLSEFIHLNNPQLTVEGYPRPRRAILLAQR